MAYKLTKSFIDSLAFTTTTGKQLFYYDSELKGFGLRVGFSSKTYIAETKINRKTVRVTIGKHGTLAPEQARKLAKEKLAVMGQNINPNAIEKDKRVKAVTLKEIYEDYMAARKQLKPTTKRDYKSCMEIYFSDWLKKPVIDITRDMIEQRHAHLSERSKARANLAMRFLRALFNFAAEYRDSKGHSIVGDNPVRRLSAKKIWNRIDRRNNYIQSHELKPWWEAVHTLKTDPNDQRTQDKETIRDYLLLLLFTGLRREEALTLTWSNVNFKAKTLTVKDTKNRLDHVLPLSTFLFDLLNRRKSLTNSEWVFPGSGKTGRITEPRKQILNVIKISSVQFSSHDLRRTFASIVNKLGDAMSYYTVKRLLNHKTADVTAGYIQHDIDKLREAMQRVTNYILKCVGNEENIINTEAV
jgi:integrase